MAALKACSALLIWDVRTDLSAGQDEAKAGRDHPLAAGAISRVAHSIAQPPASVDPRPPSYMVAWGWGWYWLQQRLYSVARAGETTPPPTTPAYSALTSDLPPALVLSPLQSR